MAEKTKNNPRIQSLLNRGRSKGYVTYEEVLDAMPEAEENLEILDEIYTTFLDEKIDVVDQDDIDLIADSNIADLEKELKATSLQATLDRAVTSDPVRMYLREIGRVALLTAVEEIELAKMIEAQNYERALERLKKEGVIRPSSKQIARIMLEPDLMDNLGRVKEAKNQLEDIKKNRKTFAMKKARVRLIDSNLRLVVSIAKKYMNRGLTFSDLIQEGNIGLMRAVDKFDWRRGFKFSTYATWWIRQAITRAIADQARTIRIPVHMIETINKLKRVQRELEQKHEREPTAKEIAKVLEIEPERVEEILKIAQEPSSLQTKVGSEGDTELAEFIQDEDTESPEQSALYELLKAHVVEVLDTLSDRERKVLELRFGLRDNNSRTLEEVGKVFGVTRERIRQIEAKALRKLRHPSRSRKLKDYLE
ncbi:RNA polymerase sigma factor RpoD [candidate division WWE3 bacterium RIFCSPLOWO2_01_FULL_39_13]|uniref:RNA polymerase sigma factor SigA n=1 Tax=candidate division WWE3 bacterium RIFCSPLOWO2_01_FULL_39_13 TaxID=1802624 RepID=A0A1F4V3J4_UNCKA|nr:MAG: RNA polymerase sigma factor RpoD [candidate division WWE3 bacterium RIFCSPLOWO2_01_FULL_39_13]